MAKQLGRLSSLHTMWMSGNSISGTAGAAIANALENHPALTRLYMGDATFGQEGFVAFANLCASNRTK